LVFLKEENGLAQGSMRMKHPMVLRSDLTATWSARQAIIDVDIVEAGNCHYHHARATHGAPDNPMQGDLAEARPVA